MDGISDASLVAALRRQMTVAAARQMATVGNLANQDTPGYKTKEVSFDSALAERLLPVNSTHPRHALAAGTAGVPLTEVQGLDERRDGNNVSIDREFMQMNQAAGDFAAAQTAMSGKFKLVRYALSETR